MLTSSRQILAIQGLLRDGHLFATATPASAEQCTWTTVGPDGRGLNADVLELGADDREEELVVEVHNADGMVARGTVPMVDLWQVY